MKKNKIYWLLAIVITVMVILCGCSGDDDEYDVIGDLKSVVFKSYGNQTLEKAAKATLTDIEWDYDDEPEIDGGFIYNASLSGVVPENDVNVSYNFQVLYKYKKSSNSSREIEVSLVSVVVDGEYFDDMDSVDFMMDLIYGN